MQGTFIAIEGSDGSGKGTQFKLLTERMRNAGFDVATFDFPRYDQPSSYFVHGYLNGAYGTADEVGPYVCSLFYALDRFDAAPQIKVALEAGKIVLVNRFTPSNMAHQGSKISDDEERRSFFTWVDNLEFNMLQIPRPDLTIVLHIPAEIAQTLIDKKEQRDYTDKVRDIHEADFGHLRRSIKTYHDLCQLFPKHFKRLDCVRGSKLLDIDTVQTLLWETVKPLLPTEKQQAAQATTKHAKLNPYIKKTKTGYQLTTAGRGLLQSAVTDSKDNVYAFTNTLNPVIIGAAMARLAERSDDIRTIILDELDVASTKDKNIQRLSYKIDKSMKQLISPYVVIEGATWLMASKLQRGRSASYSEQSAKIIHYEQRGFDGSYKYYVPVYLDEKIKSIYAAILDQIFDLYSSMLQKLTASIRTSSSKPKELPTTIWHDNTAHEASDTLRAALPLASKATIAIHASALSLENLIVRLLGDDLPEAFETGQKLLAQTRQLMPTILDDVKSPSKVSAIAYRANTAKAMSKLAGEYLPANHSGTIESVQLSSVWPRNELDLIPDMLYEHSDMALKDIQKEVSTWSYDKKQKAFNAYIGERSDSKHKPGRALEKAHYSWDIVCDYGTFRELQRHRMVDDACWQELTPRYGYDVPRVIEEAGLDDPFQQCFDLSLQLNSIMQQAGYDTESQYAMLMGHKMRYKVTYNAREAFHLHELTSTGGQAGYRDLLIQMHEKLAEHHPLIAAALKFTDHSEVLYMAEKQAGRMTAIKSQP